MLQPFRQLLCSAWHNARVRGTAQAIYIYRLDTFELETVIAGFEKTITALCWCAPRSRSRSRSAPSAALAHAARSARRSAHDPNLLATTSGEKDIKVWDIERSQVLYTVDTGKYLPKVLAWNPHDPYSMGVVTKAGNVFVWDYRTGGKPTHGYEHINAVSQRGSFRWHPNRAQTGQFAVGTTQGQLLVGTLGSSRLGRWDIEAIGKKELAEVQWDPLSETYILVANILGTVVLFDVASGTPMTVFDRAAGGLSGIAFIPGEPVRTPNPPRLRYGADRGWCRQGNFVTAGDKTGILRLWNVSQKSPKGVCRPSKSGFQNLAFAPGERGINGGSTVRRHPWRHPASGRARG